MPTDPSSVVTVTPRVARRASSAPNRWASVRPPSSMWTAQPRSRSRSARLNSGAPAAPSPTSTQVTASFGSANGRPSGPTTPRPVPAGAVASHRVAGSVAVSTISTVPPYAPVARTRWIGRVTRVTRSDSGPPTDRATTLPGRNRSATPGATRVRWWCAPTRLTLSTSPVTWTAPVCPRLHPRLRHRPASSRWTRAGQPAPS